MNQVKTYLAPSATEGIGLFAAEFIPKGAVIWQFSGLDQMFTYEEIAAKNFNPVENRYFERYSSELNKVHIFYSDDARFSNHSNDANTISAMFIQYAKVSIFPGEEITTNYREINSSFEEQEFDLLTSYKLS